VGEVWLSHPEALSEDFDGALVQMTSQCRAQDKLKHLFIETERTYSISAAVYYQN